MKRNILIAGAVLLVLGGGWLLTGGLGRAVENRIESELVARGLTQPMAACMAERMADRLTLAQLRKLEGLAPEEAEAAVPLTMPEFLERVRRLDDPQVLEVTATSAAVCAFTAR
ncbi:hypothetical protein [Erythrobacter mangrovi]|uniref:Uncharacterized protein n=1 Tax=Erythrobacter mangrovi TaxID=2739433 RepID=A0A7D4B822_9SPHN|nr:hypothetical protein [Erythrobacter mangrovi]QKG70021.1 hypothetical protein HQR01_00780 [Erythrobacter mangrovi]